MRRLLLLAPSVVALLAGCSSGQPVAAPTASHQIAAHSTAPTASPSADPDATAIIAKLKVAGLPVGAAIIYTADTDPNHLLGRPGGYTSKAAFTDTRINPSDARDSKPGSVDLGGSVEVFATHAGAVAREQYIQAALKAAPIMGTEYDYVSAGVLLRVSQLLDPSQAAGYQKALS